MRRLVFDAPREAAVDGVSDDFEVVDDDIDAHVRAEHEQVQSQIDEQVKASVIEITTEIYGGTEVRFGQRSVAVTVKTPPSAYFFSDEEIHRRALN